MLKLCISAAGDEGRENEGEEGVFTGEMRER